MHISKRVGSSICLTMSAAGMSFGAVGYMKLQLSIRARDYVTHNLGSQPDWPRVFKDVHSYLRETLYDRCYSRAVSIVM